jgi:hypothetical protein
MTIAAAIFAVMGAVLFAGGQPGEKGKGPQSKGDAEGFTLAWEKIKTAADVDFADKKKTKYTIQLDGSVEVPKDLDVVAILKHFRVRSVCDDSGAEMGVKSPSGSAAHTGAVAYNAVHELVAQAQTPQIDLNRDPTATRTMVLDTEIVVASKREEGKLPAVVMEDFKDIGQGVSVRITKLEMSAGRMLTVTLDYKRANATTTSPFMEKVFVLDPDGKDIGGGRWTEGDGPFGKTGVFTGKFKLAGTQTHQSFRFEIVTQSETRKLSFEAKDFPGQKPEPSAAEPS